MSTPLSALSEADQAALARPIWSALTGGHKELALGNEWARRYPPAIGPLAAMRETNADGWASLTRLIEENGPVVLFTVDKITPPENLGIQLASMGYQMIAANGIAAEPNNAGIVRLGASDVPEMIELVELTRPGPFGERTHELGEFIGIRENGKLAAMAGQRMRFGNFVEISAVCVHPDQRGKGYARVLMTNLMLRLRARGVTPILHTFAGNAGAIALYRKIGFETSREFHVTVLAQSDAIGDSVSVL